MRQRQIKAVRSLILASLSAVAVLLTAVSSVFADCGGASFP